MKEKISIPLSEVFVTALGHAKMNTAFLDHELKYNHAALTSLLVGYHYAEAGQVSNVVVKKDSIAFINEHSGSFSVTYDTQYFLGCSDKSYDNKNEMAIDFELTPDKNLMHLTGEEIRERADEL